MSMTLIEHIEVGSGGAASIELTSIPQTYTDLYVTLSLRSDYASTVGDDLLIRVNGVTTSVYSNRRLSGQGNGQSSDGLTNTNVPYAGYAGGASQTASTFGSTTLYFPNYSGSLAKSMSADGVSENNATNAFQVLSAWVTSETTAISSIEIEPYNGSNFVQYSSATLYGITAGSDGTTTVS